MTQNRRGGRRCLCQIWLLETRGNHISKNIVKNVSFLRIKYKVFTIFNAYKKGEILKN
jgi:hypothetical protein